jgi:cytolysin-activating lysine-acyltransferase
MHLNATTNLSIIAPALIEQNWNEAEVLGSAVWLWMHSARHKQMPLLTLPTILLPAIKQRQFILAAEAGQPVFYMSWANLSYEAEQRYLEHPLHLGEDEWNSGDRMWILDWVAPFGHSRAMSRLLENQLFANRWARTLYHRSRERGTKIKTFCGKAVFPQEAREWFERNPAARKISNKNPTTSAGTA